MVATTPTHDIHTFNDNGAWCWFQDERALIDPATNTLMIGSVAAAEGPGGDERSGNIELAVTDLASGSTEIVVLHEQLEVDDHNDPALWIRPDGRYLAMYTKHKTDDQQRWRISTRPHDATQWGPEHTFDWTELTGGRGATYSNLHYLADEDRLYAFVRAINDDPSILISDDHGETFRYGGKLFTRPKIGYVNGYTRYASNGTDRIDLITTDHHPRNYDNSIYHGYIRGGSLHRSEGTVVDSSVLDPEAPSQVELTTVLATGTVLTDSPLTHAWTTDIRQGKDSQSGQIAAVLTARANDEPENSNFSDHRFVYARHDGAAWQVFPLAKAGANLLPHEEDYTGLASIDPYDLDSLYLSAPIDPRDGAELAHHEIFHGRTSDGGATWEWTPITEDSGADNLRPIVVPGDPTTLAVTWFRGSMTASQHYDCRVVGIVSQRP
ncbi:BNR-4 repeat-containing protein [Ruania alba]|uniref:BNR repeat-containing family member n=1 Tax=Ruania alba TaxID=648782 RepID=A0A1H5L4V0_9MICO|nr:BNR-4 repeat-containing protein [Ruania alba]SEE72115.1 BNR repeat-containing family member [Ruania alba]